MRASFSVMFPPMVEFHVGGVDSHRGSTPESWRVDPYKITNFERSDAQLQCFFLFAVAVAGKKATMIAPKLHEFLSGCGHSGSPFDRIRAMQSEGSLTDNLMRVRIGKYTLLGKCYPGVASRLGLNLRTSTEDEFETLHGVSFKTARFFTCHSRKDAKVGVVDTHMLKYLREAGFADIPTGNAVGHHYARLEKAVLAEVERLGMEYADFDLKVWTWFADKNVGLPPFA